MRIKHLLFALLISICACATENGAPEQNSMPQMWQGVSKSLVKRIITEWCNYYYDDCFSGRKFDSISTVNFDAEECGDVLYATGKHSYYGRSFFGHREHHTGVDFKAWIKVSANYTFCHFATLPFVAKRPLESTSRRNNPPLSWKTLTKNPLS